ncbi:MAG: hypothetical protein PHN31_06660, partial [Candidatus Gracilibacteria bacterium]|nr:hypothetical protein [Candidatus Gracilibacteria bacterium]
MANFESSKEQNSNSKEVNPYIESTQNQIQVLKSSELSSLQGFDNFVSYLEKKALVFKSKKELDSVLAVINSGKTKELKEFLDPSNIDGGGYFFDENSYKIFEKHFSDVINVNKIENTSEEKNQTSQKVGETSQEKNTTNQEKNTTNQEKNTTNQEKNTTNQEKNTTNQEKNKEHEIFKEKYKKTRDILGNHSKELGDVIKELDLIDNNKTLDDKKRTEEFTKVFTKNQKQIFDVLFKAGKETGNYDDFKNIAHTFYDLGVINQTRLDELLGMVPKNMNKSLPQNGGNSIVSDYEKKGEELV